MFNISIYNRYMRNYNTRTSPGGGVAHHSIDSISNVYNIQHISNNICIILGPNTYYLNILIVVTITIFIILIFISLILSMRNFTTIRDRKLN